MNPEDIEHTLHRHESDLDRIANDVEKLKPLREAFQDIASAIDLLHPLVFHAMFRGAIEVRASCINEAMKLAAATAIAECVSSADLAPEYIVPGSFTPAVSGKSPTQSNRLRSKAGSPGPSSHRAGNA